LRLHAETEKVKVFICDMTYLTNVVLPAPEGAEKMISFPFLTLPAIKEY
jgi:hypothetical protein